MLVQFLLKNATFIFELCLKVINKLSFMEDHPSYLNILLYIVSVFGWGGLFSPYCEKTVKKNREKDTR